MTPQQQELLRALPSVAHVLETERAADWFADAPRATVVAAVRDVLDEYREAVREGEIDDAVEMDELLDEIDARLAEAMTPSLRRVINATGIVLHTGLGRAPLCEAAIDAIVDGASSYCNLEIDLESGRRGRRVEHVEPLICQLLACEAATVVNNNAAATMLTLLVLASGREVIVSRGELIEIGGSFRLPDIMRAGGAVLREVGTTNRTRIGDYARAITGDTAMLLRAHSSNYKVVGFTEQPAIEELVALAHEHNLVFLDDLGSGALIDPRGMGLGDEPFAADSIAAGADLVCFSGDKLLGGPQCGIIAGRESLVRQLEAHPMMRTYRPDKLVLIALEATLRQYDDEAHATESVPVVSMLATRTEVLAQRARALCQQLQEALPKEDFLVCTAAGYAGGGAMPDQPLESVVIQWRRGDGVNALAESLRSAAVPVVAVVRNDAVCFDVRTIRDEEFEEVVEAAVGAAEDESA